MNPLDGIAGRDLFRWILPIGYGKTEFADSSFLRGDCLSESVPEMCIISREAVEVFDFAAVAWCAAPSRVGSLRGRIHFSIEGFGSDERELCEIPEVRAFFTALFATLPCGLYFADTRECHAIQFLAACVCDPICVARQSESPAIEILVDKESVRRFCFSARTCLELLCGITDVPPTEALIQFGRAVEMLDRSPSNPG